MNRNVDDAVVEGFGCEWSRFDQSDLPEREKQQRFDDYFGIFPGMSCQQWPSDWTWAAAAGGGRAEVESMMREAGLVDIEFSPHAPFWCAMGRRQAV
jgi:hypothetical protein